MSKAKKYFYVNVRLLNRRCMIYKLPRDLQYPMWQYVNENPKKWQNLLKEALINVPIRPYKNNKSVIRVGIIKSVFIKKEIRVWSTRSQFLVSSNWKKKNYQELKKYRSFLKHDFSTWNQILIDIDTLRWWFRFRK